MSGKSQGYDGNTADVRVRGNAYQVLEKYLQLARDAGTVGDRVAAENFLQHADHYYRVVAAMQEGQRPRIGGRDVSVADVNVQNGSQGLSTALYSGHSQSAAPSGNDGEASGGEAKPSQGNGQQNNRQGGNHQSRGQESRSHESRGNESHGQQVNRPRDPQSTEQAGGSAGFGNGPAEAAPIAPSYAAPRSMGEQPEYPAELIPVIAPQNVTRGAGDGQAGDPNADRGERDHGRGRGRRPGRRPRPEGGLDGGPAGGPVVSSEPTSGDSGE